MTDILQLTV